MRRRRVILGDEFVARARGLFPPVGSPDGRPSYELFTETVLAAASAAFGRDFDGQQGDAPDSPVRVALTAAAPYFPVPLAFYAVLADTDTVEIIDVVIDEDWYDTFGDDADS